MGTWKQKLRKLSIPWGKNRQKNPVDRTMIKNQNKTDNDKKPSSNSGGKSSTKKGSVKTGDETPVAAYLLLGAGAVAVLAGCTWTKKNKQ
ncbi:MAG: hypothetical protein ACLRMZ_07805 [Blautia marasmi]